MKRNPLSAILVLGSVSFAANTTMVEMGSSSVFYHGSGKPLPSWSGGALVGVDDNNTSAPELHLFDKSGEKKEDIRFSIDGSSTVVLTHWTHASSGLLAVTGWTADRDGRSASFVAWTKGNRAKFTVLRTGNYSPSGIAITDDQSVWAVGADDGKSEGKSVRFAPDVSAFRRWDPSGKLIGAYLPQSSFPDPLSLVRGGTHQVFSSGGDRVGWLDIQGKRYIEISSGGAVTDLQNLSFPDQKWGGTFFLALTSGGGRPYVAANGTSWGLWELDVSSRMFNLIASGPAKGHFFLVGADGPYLVGMTSFTDGNLGFYRIQ